MSDATAFKSVLLLAANPRGTKSLRLQEEEREIKEQLRLAGYGRVPINSTDATRPRDIQKAMLDFRPQVVHFSGHGAGEEGLVFEDAVGQEKLVSSEALASLFKLFSNQLECVVLNACFSKFQAKEIARYIPYVIGMNQSIGDRAAIEFSVGFYTAMGAGQPFEFAYKLGCNAIQLEGIAEHLTPILFKEGEEVVDSPDSVFDQKNTTSNSTHPRLFLQKESHTNLSEYLPSSSNSNTNLKFPTQSQFTRQEDNLSILSTSSRNTESVEERQEPKLIIPVPSIPGTQAFEFTVVMVDVEGKEISRCRGQSHQLNEEIGNGVTLEMVYIPGGTFLMGSPESKGKRYSNERPQHSVTVKPFLISKYPITKAQWKEVASLPEVRQKLKLRPSPSGGKNHPITQVSWYDAVEFCDRLSQKTAHKYRLPSEAEWEYVCRAGTTTPFHFGETITSDLANYDARQSYRSQAQGIYREATTPVGSFQVANAFGLFDMHGNVWEWCLDHWHENYDNAPTNGGEWLDNSENQTRVMRGGSFLNDPSMCRSSSRLYQNGRERFKHIGFRIVFSLD